MRIPIYRSLTDPPLDQMTSGANVSTVDKWPVNLQAAASEETSGRTNGVRLVGIDQDIRVVSYEIYMEFSAPTDVVEFRWFQEFLSDPGSVDLPPATFSTFATRFPAGFLAIAAPWMRETLVENAGGGAVDVFPVTRQMTLVPASFSPVTAQKPNVSLHVPLAVNANWVRLAFWIDWDASVIATPANVNLYLAAMVGGHSESQYLNGKGSTVYDYDAYINRPLPEGAKVIKKG